MAEKTKDIFQLPAAVLFFLGILDVVRGFMHTFLLRWSAVHIAGFNPLTTPPDQYFLLGAFGVSNFLTGFLYFLVSRRAKKLSPYVLLIIPLAYLLGMIGIAVSGVHMQAAFEGKYFMMAYLAICVVTFGVFLVRTGQQRRRADPSAAGASRSRSGPM
ncbi:hypothetical protein A5696_22755 [Mycobacterium sp. E2699]|uniref:hypothetical protein n=1 Tax=Mycobacterium sp. E2699 TaxID=1834137 RepID=UPI0007FC3902|nr:hypothetical protein [Mycobacterium sp. E2699]OBH07495.1 hypothetical protein A5696_22755 [Mycobacterium sp. E2699]